MIKKLIFTLFILSQFTVMAQEMNCYVEINFNEVKQSNRKIFGTLQQSLSDFINKNRWTNRAVNPQEKIDCSVFVRVREFVGQEFVAELQVQSARPVYNSTYSTPVLNFKDEQFRFSYVEFQDMTYNSFVFNSNLLSVMTFYIYTMIGMDADTYALMGGSPFYQEAQKVMNLAQGNGYKGWDSTDGNQTRFRMITDLTSGTFDNYRQALYEYHRNGLDMLADNPRKAKESIAKSFLFLEEMNSSRPNSMLLRMFFDAKSDEIFNVFSEGPAINLVSTLNVLNKLAPQYASRWAMIQN
ncbi:MAG: DUF4835 family protein [Flavobacteriaceae bacterium]|nr:DUF4835 family protein [Flavobacteriaceae bacterium]